MTEQDINTFFDRLIYDINNVRNYNETLENVCNKIESQFKKYRKPSNNILIIHCDKIGDSVLISGFIREVRKNFPRAHITLISSPIAYPLVQDCPYVNEVMFFDEEERYAMEGFTNTFVSIIQYCKVYKLWGKNYDIAFLPKCGQNVFITLMLAWLTGAKERVGFVINPYGVQQNYNPTGVRNPIEIFWSNFCLTRPIYINDSLISHSDKIMYILKKVGLKVSDTSLELFLNKENISLANNILKNIKEKKIVVGIEASEKNKTYPIEKLLKVLEELSKDNFCFVIISGSSGIQSAKYLEQRLPKILNLAGKTKINEAAAIVNQCDYYLGNDTGITHIAAAAKLPCLVISREASSTKEKLPKGFCENDSYAPWNTKYKIVNLKYQIEDCETLPPVHGGCHKKEAHCIAEIKPEDIIESFRQLISK